MASGRGHPRHDGPQAGGRGVTGEPGKFSEGRGIRAGGHLRGDERPLPVPESGGHQVVWRRGGFRTPRPAGHDENPSGFSRRRGRKNPAGRGTEGGLTAVDNEVPQARRHRLRCRGAAVPFLYEGEEGGLVFARDISERRRAEEALRESRESFRRVVENAPEAIFVGRAAASGT